MGLRLSPEKTLITHIDEGLDFLGWRIQRHRKRGTGKYYVYVYPAKKALVAVMAKVKAWCRQNTNLPLDVLLRLLNRMLRGWTAYFKYGCSKATFGYLRSYLWKEIVRWQGRKHRRVPWKQLRTWLDLRRARCPVMGTAGSGGGSEKPTSGNAGRALRADLTCVSEITEMEGRMIDG